MEKQGIFEIILDIIANFTLVQLMDTFVNVNNLVNMVGYWIFESNNKNSLFVILDALNIVCYPSVGEGIFAMFQTLFHKVRYINNRGKLKSSE